MLLLWNRKFEDLQSRDNYLRNCNFVLIELYLPIQLTEFYLISVGIPKAMGLLALVLRFSSENLDPSLNFSSYYYCGG